MTWIHWGTVQLSNLLPIWTWTQPGPKLIWVGLVFLSQVPAVGGGARTMRCSNAKWSRLMAPHVCCESAVPHPPPLSINRHSLPVDISVSFADVITLSSRRASTRFGGGIASASRRWRHETNPQPVRSGLPWSLASNRRKGGSLRRMSHEEAVAKQFTNQTVGLRSIISVGWFDDTWWSESAEARKAKRYAAAPPTATTRYLFPRPGPRFTDVTDTSGSLTGPRSKHRSRFVRLCGAPPVVHRRLAEAPSAGCKCSTGVSTSLTEK